MTTPPFEPFTIATHYDGRTAVIEIAGEFDLAGKDPFDDAVDTALAQDVDTVHVDARSLRFIDSAGLATIVSAGETAHDQGVRLRITAVSDEMRRVMEIAGLADLLPGTGGPRDYR